MADDEQDDFSFSQSMWEEFSMYMDSSSLGQMQRIATEARMGEEMEAENVEITSVNEAMREANYGNELWPTIAVRDDNYGNEVEIAEAREEDNYGNEVEIAEAREEDNYGNEVVIVEVTEEVNYGNEVVITQMADNTISVNEAKINNISSGKEKASARSKQMESLKEKRPPVKMRHFLSRKNYSFVLGLIRAVKKEMRKKDGKKCSKERRRKKSPFSHFKRISCQEKEFNALIKESIPADHICIFETCKERFIETYKPKPYTESGFVNFCAAIAYLGIHCSTSGLDPGGENKAINYICSLLYEVLQRGTLNHSTWGRSYFELE